MLLMTYLTGRPGFISDPVIDTTKNQIIYAHCVAPSRVFGPNGKANPYHIRTKLAAEVRSFDKLFNEWDQHSWHRVTFYGDYKQDVETISTLIGFKVVEEG